MTGKQLKNSILQWAIQGKLVPQDPNDEPASVLLEKIRQDKERLIKEKKIKRDKNASIIYRGEDNSYYEKFLATGEVKCIDEEIPFEIPSGWEWCRLGNVSSVYGGKRIPAGRKLSTSDTGHKYIRVSDMKNSSVLLDNIQYVSEDIYQLIKAYTISKDDLYITVAGTIGSVGEIPEELNNANLTENADKIVFTIIDKRFLMYALQSELVQSQIKECTTKVGQPKLAIMRIQGFLIALPPLNEQKRIVGAIEVVMPSVSKYEQAQIALEKLNTGLNEKIRKSVLQEAIQGKILPQDPNDEPTSILLQRIKEEKHRLVKEGKLKKKDVVYSVIYKGDDNKYYEQIGKRCEDITEEIPFDLPDSWAWVRMGQIGDWGAGSTPHRSNVEYYNGDILWLKTGELNNSVVYDTEEKITQKALSECSLRLNRVGDILIAMYGATIGKVAIAGKEMTTNQACCGCTPFLVNNWYLFYYLMASRDVFIKKGEGGAQPNISRVKLVEHLMPLPPLQEQQRIVAQIEKLFEQLK